MTFAYRNGVLCAEEVPLTEIAARFATPCFVYSKRAIEDAYGQFVLGLQGRDAQICYSVKANSNLAILALLAHLGAGFDIVSGGELARVLAAGGDPRRTFFSGVGKSAAEIEVALKSNVACINVESEPELARIDAVARQLGRRAPVAFRVNPDIDARTHPYISTGLRENKFGIPYNDAERLYEHASHLAGIDIVGVGCHIGSQLSDPAPFAEAAGRMGILAEQLARRGIRLKHIDIGGGIGIRYRDENPQSIAAFLSAARKALDGRSETLVVDPGRSIVGNAGVLLTRVEYVKRSSGRNFVVIDAAMNDLLRPALYGAWHEIKAVREGQRGEDVYDVVGPVCESADFIAKDRKLEAREGDLLAVMSTGAYGMSMSSNYNSRPRAAEVLVAGQDAQLVRKRELTEQLFALERLPGQEFATP